MYQICVKKRRVKRGSSLTIARLSKVAVYTVVVNITSILKTIVHYFHKSENPSRPLNLEASPRVESSAERFVASSWRPRPGEERPAKYLPRKQTVSGRRTGRGRPPFCGPRAG